MNPDLFKIINAKIDKMPPLSPSVEKILEIANNPMADPRDLDKVISMDPVLTGRVLKLVNSAYFSLSAPVSRIFRAIILLGFNTVKNLALSSAVITRFSNPENESAMDMEKFWEHSLAVAVSSKLCSGALTEDQNFQEEFFIAGLLHDFGKICLDNIFPLKTIQARETAAIYGAALIDVEDSVMGVNHAQIGGIAAEKWKFSDFIINVIKYHHTPEKSPGDKVIVNVISLADKIVNSLESGLSDYPPLDPDIQTLMEELKIPPPELYKRINNLLPEMQKARAFLKVKN
jgi:HD-like signal output (HDOD) protein